MIRGRPFEPGNKLSRGRPKGSRNKSPSIGDQLVVEHERPLHVKNLAEALRHDTRSRLWCLVKLEQMREKKLLSCKLKLPPIKTLDDIAEAWDIVLDAVLNHKRTAADGQALCAMLRERRNMIEAQEQNRRIEALERLEKVSG